MCYRAHFLWSNLPPEYKLVNSLNLFKRKVETGKDKIVHEGYATRTSENRASFSFPWGLFFLVTLFRVGFFYP